MNKEFQTMRCYPTGTRLISALTMLIGSIILLSACTFDASPVDTPATSVPNGEPTTAGPTRGRLLRVMAHRFQLLIPALPW
jgi:hypothetical protein